MAWALLTCLLALVLDFLVGEPRRWHPLVGLGWYADRVEAALNPGGRGGILAGGLATVLVVLPVLGVALVAAALPSPFALVAAVMLLWVCIGHCSLAEHGMAVYRPLMDEDLGAARERAGMMVSRDTRG
ncbi:MAG: cobalamin biosynthesis protein, partial [Halospina sp.]